MDQANYLIIVGRGTFAQVFADKIEALAEREHEARVHPVSWDGSIPAKNSSQVQSLAEVPVEQAVILHVGSGRQFTEAMNYCDQHRVPLIQASTAKEIAAPQDVRFPYIVAPNLSLPILKVLYLLESQPDLFKGFDISVHESHQASKTSLPGTARKLADLLHVSPDQVESIRDPQAQITQWGVPKEYLSGHAMHRVSIEGKGAEVTLGTRVWGRDTYLYGVLEILRIKEKLQPKKYFVTELIRERWI